MPLLMAGIGAAARCWSRGGASWAGASGRLAGGRWVRSTVQAPIWTATQVLAPRRGSPEVPGLCNRPHKRTVLLEPGMHAVPPRNHPWLRQAC